MDDWQKVDIPVSLATLHGIKVVKVCNEDQKVKLKVCSLSLPRSLGPSKRDDKNLHEIFRARLSGFTRVNFSKNGSKRCMEVDETKDVARIVSNGTLAPSSLPTLLGNRHEVFSLSLPSSRIIGGQPVAIEQFPSTAAILLKVGVYHEYICGGAILTSFYVVTSGQCASKEYLTVRVGSSYRSSGGTTHDVKMSIIHPSSHEGADLAVLALATPILMNHPGVGQAPLPFQDMEPTVGMTAFLLSWGAESISEKPSESLQYGILSIVDRDSCAKMHTELASPYNVTAVHMCADEPGVDLCVGGLGSPLFSSGVFVGIAAYGTCGTTNAPSIYTQVSRYTNWLVDIASGVPKS